MNPRQAGGIVDDVHLEAANVDKPLQGPVDPLQIWHGGQHATTWPKVVKDDAQPAGGIVEVLEDATREHEVKATGQIGVRCSVERVAAEDLAVNAGARQVGARQVSSVGFDFHSSDRAPRSQ